MQLSSQTPPNPDLHGVVELARMQIAMQRELTALRTQKLVLTQQQMSGADRQATLHLSAELREARTQISALRQDVVRLQQALDQTQSSFTHARKAAETDKDRMAKDIVRLQQALDQAQGSLIHVRKVAETDKDRMASDIASHRARCESLRGALDEIKHSWSWRIGNGIVRMGRFLLWPVARPRGATRSRTPA